jgi:hypothetical protein
MHDLGAGQNNKTNDSRGKQQCRNTRMATGTGADRLKYVGQSNTCVQGSKVPAPWCQYTVRSYRLGVLPVPYIQQQFTGTATVGLESRMHEECKRMPWTHRKFIEPLTSAIEVTRPRPFSSQLPSLSHCITRTAVAAAIVTCRNKC